MFAKDAGENAAELVEDLEARGAVQELAKYCNSGTIVILIRSLP